MLIIESKFWTGLTDNQPVAYLRRLPPEKDGVLLFVAPDKRLAMLWPELIRRCNQAGCYLQVDGDRGNFWRLRSTRGTIWRLPAGAPC